MSASSVDVGLPSVHPSHGIDVEGRKPLNDVLSTGNDLSPLVLRGLFLTIVTLGIYRFWYKTDLRRWYWRNTIVGGSALEYRGTAKELFIGFLIALAVVMPLYGLGFMLTLFTTEAVDLALKPVIGVIFILLVQYGAYRSRRYRLTRTVWRGLRFDQSGSAVTYALKSLGWFLVTLLTLGLAFPWMRHALERYRIENTLFGSARGSFDAPVSPLLKRWLSLVLPTAALLAIGGYEAATSAVWNPVLKQYRISGISTGLIFMAVIWPFAFWPAYRAAELRVFTGGTRLGPVSFISAFQTKQLYKLYLKLFALMLLAVILIGVAAVIILPVLFRALGAVGAAVALVLPYLAGFFLFAWLKETVFNQGFWRHAAARLAINNLAAADEVLGGSIKDESAAGEGFADALDFGGV